MAVGTGSYAIFAKIKDTQKAKKEIVGKRREEDDKDDNESEERNLKMAAHQAESFHDLWELFNISKEEGKKDHDQLISRVIKLEVENVGLENTISEKAQISAMMINDLQIQVMRCKEGNARTEAKLVIALTRIAELEAKYEGKTDGWPRVVREGGA